MGWDPIIAPTAADGFTIEAWVGVGWGGKDGAGMGDVLRTIETSGGFKGFGIVAPKNETGR